VVAVVADAHSPRAWLTDGILNVVVYVASSPSALPRWLRVGEMDGGYRAVFGARVASL